MAFKSQMEDQRVQELLPHLVAVLREARLGASLTFAHVAVRVRKKDGRVGVSESSISRFEQGTHWPMNPDSFVAGYAEATGVPACELWQAAAERCANPPKPRKKR